MRYSPGVPRAIRSIRSFPEEYRVARMPMSDLQGFILGVFGSTDRNQPKNLRFELYKRVPRHPFVKVWAWRCSNRVSPNPAYHHGTI